MTPSMTRLDTQHNLIYTTQEDTIFTRSGADACMQVAAAKLPDGKHIFDCIDCVFEGASSEERYLEEGPSAMISLVNSTVQCLAMVEDYAGLMRAQSRLGLDTTAAQACPWASIRNSMAGFRNGTTSVDAQAPLLLSNGYSI